MKEILPTQRSRPVLNDEARLEILQRHDTQVEEENKAKEARRVDKSRRRRDEFSVSLLQVRNYRLES